MRVIAVEYLNTVPFIWGMECVAPVELHAHLHLCPPAQCAEIALKGECDIALVPVVTLPQLPPDSRIITNYCISATGEVETVVMLSNSPLHEIKKIYLDTHSRTSVKLCEVLCREWWKISVELCAEIPAELSDGEAIVAIGDKVFEMERQYQLKWDLSQQWLEFTGLPFVFAVWVALTKNGEKIENQLNNALCYGATHIDQAVDSVCLPDDPLRPRFVDYLSHKIEYDLSPLKLKALELFLSKLTQNTQER